MANYLIIGASSGIGEAFVQLEKQSENKIFASYNSNPKQSDGNIHYFHYDVLKEDNDLSFLPDRLDGLLYCPGKINLKPFHRLKESDFIEDYKIQVLGAIKLIQLVLDKLKKSNQSSIVLFSSIAVQSGFNFHSLISCSKGAIEGLTKALANELSPTIRVNAIAPSLTDTPLAERLLNSPEKKESNAMKNPLKKIGTAEEIATLASFLLGTKASWISGQIIHIDGGMSTIIK